MPGRRIMVPPERRPKKRAKDRLLPKPLMILYWIAVVLSAIIVTVFCVWKLTVRPPEIPQTQVVIGPNGEIQQQPEGLARREGCYTFLLMGTDDGNGNADTLMVASYDVPAGRIGIVSIPRDTILEGKSGYPKINGTYSGGNVERVRNEVSRLLGIPIDFYIKVDLQGFVKLVNEVGGVDFYVPVDMDYDDPAQGLSIHYKKGMQYLTGQQALEVVRFRHNNDMTGYSDTGRTNTQQQLIRAVMKKVLSWGGVTKIRPILDICTQYVQTDLEAGELLYFAEQIVYMDLDSGLATTTLSGRGDATHNGYKWCFELDKEKTLQDINTLLNPYNSPVTDEMAHIAKANG